MSVSKRSPSKTADIAELLKMYPGKFTASEVCRMFKCHIGVVRYVVKDQDLELKSSTAEVSEMGRLIDSMISSIDKVRGKEVQP